MPRSIPAIVSSLGILLGTTGCNDSPAPTSLDHAFLASADSSGSIGGNVVNSDSLPVARARVLFFLVGPVPPDSSPPDTTPPDTLPPDTTRVSPAGVSLDLAGLKIDSIPGDSTPPPPPARCGDRGQLVARTRSDRDGNFQTTGLAPGVYDVRAETESGRGAVCGVILRGGQQAFVSIMLSRRGG